MDYIRASWRTGFELGVGGVFYGGGSRKRSFRHAARHDGDGLSTELVVRSRERIASFLRSGAASFGVGLRTVVDDDVVGNDGALRTATSPDRTKSVSCGGHQRQ